MGAIAAAFDKMSADATTLVLTMLEELKHRGTRKPAVTGQPLTYISQFLDESKNRKAFSKAAVGSNSSDPILGENYILVLEGQFFPPSESSIHQVMHEMSRQPLKNAGLILKQLDGSYAFAIAFPDRILVGRDTMGLKPLYYGENESICAISSERKALWKIGISNVHSFPPGNLAIINEIGFAFEPISTLRPPPQKSVGMKKAARHLQELLQKSTQDRVSDVKKVTVAFSGGLDSSLVASLAQLAGVHVHTICVGLTGQREIDYARDAARRLGLPLTVQEHTVADVEDLLPKVLWLIEEPDVMKASVAIPFYWTAEVASKLRCQVLLAGQGADELFGGYHKYLTEYAKGGAEKIREALFRDTALSHKTNFQRDEPVCAYHKVELRLPFIDAEIVHFALSLPISLKIKSATDSLRKRVLRQVAKNIGMPASIVNRPKKAVQFATGVDKALEKLAGMEDLTQRSYISKVFKEVHSNMEGKSW